MTVIETLIPTPALRDALAARGLEPSSLLVEIADADGIARARATWAAWQERAAEIGISVQQVAGTARAAGDILRCQHDPAAVADLAPLIGQAGQPTAAVIQHAQNL